MKNFITPARLLSLGLLLQSASAAPAPQVQTATATSSAQTGGSTPSASDGSGTNACALIGAAIARSGAATTLAPSQVSLCLQDVPFNRTAAVAFVDYLLTFTEFQSNLNYLKAPPSDYPYPATDVVARLQAVRASAAVSNFSSHYNFDRAVYDVVTSARDGHYKAVPVLVGAFSLRRPPLVSISSDGVEVPKIFFRSDVYNTTGNFTPSAITEINGQDPAIVTGSISVLYQDPDASYNSAFYNPANFRVFGNGDFALGRLLSFNDSTTYSFANGSSVTLPNIAIPSVNLTGVTSGADFYRKLVAVAPSATNVARRAVDPMIEHLLKRQASSSLSRSATATGTATATVSATASARATVLPAQLGLPSPVAISPDLSISGYFLDEQPDTAFLYVAQFTAEGPTAAVEFQDTVTDFLDLCRKRNKKRLVIDLRGNPGGAVFTAYDLFKQILPKKALFTKVRQRAHPGQDVLGTVLSTLGTIGSSDVREGNKTAAQTRQLVGKSSGFNVNNNLQSPDAKPYKSWRDFSPPQRVLGDTVTNYYARSFANEPLASLTGSGVIVAGYGSNKDLGVAYFDPANITLITDVQCSSSCGVFSNLMVSQGNVSTLAFGGRPNKNRVNLIGGTQGANVQSASTLAIVAAAAADLVDANAVRVSDAQATALESLLADPPVRLLSGGVSVNFLDNFLPDSDVPLQFRQRAAECRAFYVADDIASMRRTWARVAAGNITCVDGGAKPGTGKRAGSGGSGGASSGAASLGAGSAQSLLAVWLAGVVSVLLYLH